MAFEFKFPDVGEGIHEGKVVEWLVGEGDTVAEDQPLVKVETDKAVVELPSPRAGVVLKILFQAGQTIHVGEVFVVIGEKGEKAAGGRAQVQKTERPLAPPPPAPAPSPPARPASPEPQAAPHGARPLATPHTRALARKLGVDLARLRGSGKGGRITDVDVEKAASAPAAPTAPAPSGEPARVSPKLPSAPLEITDSGPVERLPVSHLRKVIAENMSLSKSTSAHVTHVDEADVTGLVALYKSAKSSLEAGGGGRLTLLPFFMKAVAVALRSHPLLNASYDEARGEIILKRYFNIGIAVDTPEGLVVPVVRDVDKKGIAALAEEVADLSQRARERRLALDELRHGSFTITNIGPLGGLFATPIIRQPELAIVGLHTIKERPAVVDGGIAIRSMMYLSVSFDHRIIDGAEAARFMTDLVKIVSNPGLLLVTL